MTYPYGNSDGGCTSIDCVVKVFDVIASLYVNAYRYTYDQVFNGREDGGGTIDDTIIGANFTDSYDLETIVASICQIYRIERDFSEAGLRLYRNAGIEEPNTILITLDADELAVTDTASDGIRYSVATTYNSAANSPSQIAFNFIDAGNDYKANQLTAKRADAVQTDPVTQISLPFVMETAKAEKLINRLLGDSRLQLIEHSFRLPPKYAWLGKGDVIQINHGIFADVVRIKDTDFNADKSQSVTAVTVGTSTREIKTTEQPTYQGVSSGPIVNSDPLFFDIPTLTPGQCTGPGIAGMFEMYYGVAPSAKGFWTGGYIARQLSADGEAYATLFDIVGQSDKAGSCTCKYIATNALKDKRWVTDSDPLTLAFPNADWPIAGNTNKAGIDASATKNLAVYGDDDRWELIQFEAIVNNTMTGIVRGLRGTEVNCGKHKAGDRVILLSPGVALMRLPVARLAQSSKYRGVSEGQSFLQTPQVQALPFRGNSRKPFAPYHFKAERQQNGDIKFSWQRRDRGGTGWGKACPNSESNLSFTVLLATESGGFIRQLAAADTSVIYTTAAQGADGTAGVSRFQLNVAQIGDIGTGFLGTELVNG